MSDERMVAPSFGDGDLHERSLRPERLEDFIGQRQLRENLSVFVEAAKSRNEALLWAAWAWQNDTRANRGSRDGGGLSRDLWPCDCACG